MSWENDDAFGGFWDIGESLSPDFIGYPLKMLINDSARSDGIDLSDPERKIAAMGASTFLGAVGGVILGPVGVALMGAMGYAAGLCVDDSEATKRRKAQMEIDKAVCMKRVKAFEIAYDVTREHVSQPAWNHIVEELRKSADRICDHVDSQSSPLAAFNIFENQMMNDLNHLNQDVYRNFYYVLMGARRELGIE